MKDNVADWILHPLSERELTEERRVRIARRRTGFLLALGLVLCPLSCFAGSPSALPVPLLVIALGLEFFRRSQIRSDFDQNRQNVLFHEYREVHGGWVVDLTIYQGFVPTGKDQGVVWFEDGRLYFSGHRTSFALAPSDVRGTIRTGWRVDSLQSALTLDLSKTTVGKLSLGFDVVGSSTKPPNEFTDWLSLAIRDWVAGNTPAETQWPPLALGPGAPSERTLLVRAIVPSSFWLFAAALALNWPRWDATLPILFFAFLFAVFCPEVWLPHRRWLAYRDRRRLDRSRP